MKAQRSHNSSRRAGARALTSEARLCGLFRGAVRLAHELGNKTLDRVTRRAGQDEEYYGALLAKNALTFESLRVRSLECADDPAPG